MTEESAPIRIVYFGTPSYAVPALRALVADRQFRVELVVTQPDRPAGRGHGLSQSAVKTAATELDLPVYQPAGLRRAQDREPIASLGPDLFVVAAYGLIFGPKMLAIPTHGSLNLHASLLPSYRGASPVTAAILAGDSETGVTLMQMDVGMDTGGIVAMQAIPILPEETTGSLTERLGVVGAGLASRTIPRFIAGEVVANPQPAAGGSTVRPLVKNDGWIDWNRSADEIERRIRAMQPWPRAFTSTPAGLSILVLRARVSEPISAPPGTVVISGRDLRVATGRDSLTLERVQPAGSAEMDATSLIQGRKLQGGDRLGVSNPPEPLPPLIRPF